MMRTAWDHIRRGESPLGPLRQLQAYSLRHPIRGSALQGLLLAIGLLLLFGVTTGFAQPGALLMAVATVAPLAVAGMYLVNRRKRSRLASNGPS